MSMQDNQQPDMQKSMENQQIDTKEQQLPTIKITSFRRQDLKPPTHHNQDPQTNILIFTPNKKLSFIENYIKDKLYTSNNDQNSEILQEKIKLVRCNRIDSLYTVLTTQIKEGKIAQNSNTGNIFRRNICISDHQIDEQILGIFIKAMGTSPFTIDKNSSNFSKNELFSYVLFTDNVEKVNSKNFHAKQGVELITSQQNKVIQFFDHLSSQVIDAFHKSSKKRQLSAAVSSSTINSKDEQLAKIKFQHLYGEQKMSKSIEVNLGEGQNKMKRNKQIQEEEKGQEIYLGQNSSPGVGKYDIANSSSKKTFGKSGEAHKFGSQYGRSNPQKWANSGQNFSKIQLAKSREIK